MLYYAASYVRPVLMLRPETIQNHDALHAGTHLNENPSAPQLIGHHSGITGATRQLDSSLMGPNEFNFAKNMLDTLDSCGYEPGLHIWTGPG